MARPALAVEVDGLMETLKSVRGIQDALERKETNAALRSAAKSCAQTLAAELRQSAHASAVPVAPRVAESIRVKSDRVPVVTVGGPKKVGRTGAAAARLVWGSEQGPKSDVNHWGVPASPGYWIAPAVERFQHTGAIRTYQRAVYEILKDHKLV